MKKAHTFFCMILSVLGFSGITSAIPTDGLIAEYLFNGNVNDTSGNENHGISQGATLTEDRFGNPNRAYQVAENYGPYGGGNYIQIPNTVNDLTSLTISLWVKEYEIGYVHGEDYISFGAPSFGLVHIQHEVFYDYIQFTITNPTQMIGFTVDFNDDWIGSYQHYALTYDGIEGVLKGYINGQVFGEVPTEQGLISTYSDNGHLGRHIFSDGSTTSSRFNGAFDDVHIYNRALFDSELLQLHNAPNPIPEPTTMLLLGSGLIGLAGLRRRFNKKVSCEC